MTAKKRIQATKRTPAAKRATPDIEKSILSTLEKLPSVGHWKRFLTDDDADMVTLTGGSINVKVSKVATSDAGQKTLQGIKAIRKADKHSA